MTITLSDDGTLDTVLECIFPDWPSEEQVMAALAKADADQFWPSYWVTRERGGHDMIVLNANGTYTLVE